MATVEKAGREVPPGTHAGNSICPVIATDRVDEFGYRIFENHALAKGRRDCIVHNGMLYGAEMAPHLHAQALVKVGPAMLAALRLLVVGDGQPDECPRAMAAARAVLRDIGEVA